MMILNVQSEQLGVGCEMPIYPVFPEVRIESQLLIKKKRKRKKN